MRKTSVILIRGLGFVIFATLGLAADSQTITAQRVALKRGNVVATLADVQKESDQRLNFSLIVLEELLKGLDSAPGVFNATLSKGETELKRLNSRESLLGDLDACSEVLNRRKVDLDSLRGSRCFGEAARVHASEIEKLQRQINEIKAGLLTSSRRLEAVISSVTVWQKSYAESVPIMGRPQTVEMIRGFVEREITNERMRHGNRK